MIEKLFVILSTASQVHSERELAARDGERGAVE
jgi:hypothetical protein